MTSTRKSFAVPPTLEPGGVIRFRSAEQLQSAYEREMAVGRLSAIDALQPALFEEDTYMIVVAPGNDRVELRAMCVHRQGDIVGMQLIMTDEVLAKIAQMMDGAVHDGLAPHQEAANEVSIPSDTVESTVAEDTATAADDGDLMGLLVDTPDPRAEASKAPRPVRPSRAPRSQGPSRPRATSAPPSAQRQASSVMAGELKPLDEAKSYLTGASRGLLGVLLALQRSCKSGQLTVVIGAQHWSVCLDQHGCVVDFDVNLVGQLVAAGLLDNDTLKSARTSERLSAACARLRNPGSGVTLPPVSVFRQSITDALVEQLKSLAAEDGATYYFDPGVKVYDTGFSVPFLIYGRQWLSDVAQAIRVHEAEELYQSRFEMFPVIVRAANWCPSMLNLSSSENRLVNKALPRGQTLRKLLTFSPMSRTQTMRTLFWLQGLDMVTFRVQADEQEQSNEGVAALEARLKSARVDHFSALGLHITAHHTEIPTAFQNIQAIYGPASSNAALSESAGEVCQKILAQAGEAHRFLSHQQQRVEYRRDQHTETELTAFAQLLIDKMRLATLRGEQHKAARLKQVALELSPRVVKDALSDT